MRDHRKENGFRRMELVFKDSMEFSAFMKLFMQYYEDTLAAIHI